MNTLKKKLIITTLVTTVATTGLTADPFASMTTPFVAQANSIANTLLSGVAAMAVVNSQLKKMDDSAEGQADSYQRTKAQTGYYDNEEAQQRVQTILTNLSKSSLVKRSYKVYVNPKEDFNAFMTIGRVMSINKGALDTLDDNELAYVIAHEISHGEHKDIINGVRKQIGTATAVSIASSGSGSSALLSQIAGQYVTNQVFTMSQEKAADELGFKILVDSPYNIGGASAAMAVMYDLNGDRYREGLAQVLAPNNHPKSSDRITANNTRLHEYSGNHVIVKEGSVYVNDVNIYKPAKSGRYSGIERSYLMAGKLARLYHDNKITPDSASYYGDTVSVSGVSIVTTPNSEVASMVATNLNKAFSKGTTVDSKVKKSDKKIEKKVDNKKDTNVEKKAEVKLDKATERK